MEKSFEVLFDGEVFRPASPPGLEPNTRYVITIHEAAPAASDMGAWDVLESLAGTIEAPADWATQHDHYLYGTPKKRRRPTP
jgi:hypothetical protein